MAGSTCTDPSPATFREFVNGAEVEVYRVNVHSGFLSVDNGAHAPLSLFSDLAKLTGLDPLWGVHYYDDVLQVPLEQWPVIQELLVESKLLYRLQGVDLQWQNVQSDKVRQILRR